MDLQFGDFDCEDSRDFVQYYRNRYFGYPLNDRIAPATHVAFENKETIVINVFDASTGQVRTERVPWVKFRMLGKFGHPILGNVDIGPTMAYTYSAPRRESVKGINMTACRLMFPKQNGWDARGQDVLGLFSRKDSLFSVAYLGAGDGTYYQTLEEFKILEALYNRSFWRVGTAFRALADGDRIGCSITHKLGLYTTGEFDKIQILYRGHRIGDVDSDRRVELLPDHKYLLQTVTDTLSQE